MDIVGIHREIRLLEKWIFNYLSSLDNLLANPEASSEAISSKTAELSRKLDNCEMHQLIMRG